MHQMRKLQQSDKYKQKIEINFVELMFLSSIGASALDLEDRQIASRRQYEPRTADAAIL